MLTCLLVPGQHEVEHGDDGEERRGDVEEEDEVGLRVPRHGPT